MYFLTVSIERPGLDIWKKSLLIDQYYLFFEILEARSYNRDLKVFIPESSHSVSVYKKWWEIFTCEALYTGFLFFFYKETQIFPFIS